MNCKRLLLMLLLAIGLPWAANAQETANVVSGGTGTNQYVPMYNYYNDYGHRSEYIIPASYFATAGINEGDQLTSMTIYRSATGTWTAKNLTIILTNTTTSYYDNTSFLGKEGTTVYLSSSYPGGSASSYIFPFTEPFEYTGGSLVVHIWAGNGGTCTSNSNSSTWLGYNNTENSQALYAYGSNSANASTGTSQSFLPNTTFTYEPAQSGGDVCEKPATLVAEDVTGNSATLTWTGGSGVYNIELNGTIIEENYEGYTYNLTGLAATTAYTAKVQSVCDGTTPTSGWKSVSFTTPCASYDIPYTYDFEAEAPFACWTPITGVTRGNSSSYAHNSTYYLRFAGTTSNLVALPQFNETTNNLRVEFWTRPESSSAPGSYSNYSGKFAVGYMTDITDASTFVAVDTYIASEMTTSYVKKTVDLVNAPAGANIAMRQFDCATNYYWFVDDITVKAIPSCLAPTDLAATASTTSAELSWTANSGETAWTVYWKKTTDENYTEVANATNPYTLNGLDASTNYQYYVMANCSADEASEASEVFPFVTECEAISTYPWTENFDSYTGATSGSTNNLPLCWNYINTSTYSYYKGYPVIYSASGYSHSGNNHLRFYSSYSTYSSYDPQDQYAILPEMENLNGKQLSLFARGANTNSSFKVGLMTDPTDVNTFVEIATTTPTTGYVEYIYNLTGTGNYIAIMMEAANSTATSRTVYIDDISIAEPPACPKPTDLTVVTNSVNPHSVQLSWVSDATAWIVAYKTAEEEEFTEVDATENPYTLTGLTDGKTYTAKVCAVCDGTPGEWTSNTVSFTTPIACPAPTNLAVSGTTGSQTTLNWTGTSDSYDVLYRTAAYAEGIYENFGTSIPSGWEMYTGLLTNGTATMTSATYSWSFGTGNGVFDDHARVNIYDNNQRWLVTKAFTILQDASTLSFDLALTAFSGSEVPAPATTGTDDKFIVLISTDNMSSWITLREWNNSGSEYVYNNIANTATGENVVIDLSAYVGQNVRIAFYGESTESNADNNLHIDNVYCGIPHEAGEWQTAAEGVTGTTYTLTGLNPETDYEAKVLSNCEGETGHETVISFTTEAACMVPTELTVVSVTTTTAELTWTSSSTAWQIQVNEEEPIDVTSIPYTLEGLSPATTYTFKVRANCDGSYTDWSNAASFTTECDVIAAEGYSENFDSYTAGNNVLPLCWSYINTTTYSYYQGYPRVYANGSYSIYSNSAPNCLYFYSYYSSYSNYDPQPQYAILPEMNGLAGKQVTLMAKGYSSTSTFKIGTMSDPADASTFQQIAEQALTTSYQEFEFVIPANVSGNYLAIMIDAANEDRTSNGVYIDDIVISTPPTCLKPTDLEVTAPTTTTATFSWTNGAADPTAWQICLNGDETNLIMADSNPFTVEGLTASTSYTAKVRAYCSEEDQSDWSNEVSFATECDVIAAEGYSENFDSYEVASSSYYPSSRVLPNCWSAINTTTDYGYDAFPSIYYYEYTNYANSTPNCLMLYSYYEYDDYWSYEENDPQPQYAILPEMTGLAGMQVTLQARGYNTSSTFKIGTMSDPTDASTFTMIAEQTGLTSSYQEFECLIPADCQNRYLAIMIDAANSSREDNGVYIDDIVISTPPTCLKPTALECTATTTTTATFGWTNGSDDQTAWQICLNGDEENLIMANSNPFTVEGLTASTAYTAKVRAYCSADDQSDWSNEVSFATECEAIVVDVANPFTEDFEGDWTPLCWESIPYIDGTTTRQWTKTSSSSNIHTGAGAAYSGYYGPIYLVMPELQLGTDGAAAQLTFWSYNTWVSDYDKNSVVLLDGENEIELWSPESVAQSWEETTIDLTAYMGQTISLAFKYEGVNAHGWYIDDVEVSLLPPTTVTQTIELAAGSNWVSFNVDITLDDLKAALVAVSPEATIKISGQSTSITYVPRTHRWTGNLNWDLAKMYIIRVTDACEISLEGMPINPAEHPVTIVKGTNYIGFPFTENMSLTDAFAGFAINGDKILSKSGNATYNRNRWQGQSVTNLEPGKGYIYKSNSTEDRPFVFPTNAKK